jgi:tRNA-binding protein
VGATEISWEQFTAVEMRVGRIERVEEFPEARNPSYKLYIYFGDEIGLRQTSAQVTRYSATELVGTQVVCVLNFPPKRIAGFKSEVLVLGVPHPEGGISLLRPEHTVELGGRVY